jgi:hypothetical protein
MNPVDPIVLAKKVQSATYCFIKTPGGDFDRMFRTIGVATRYFASSETHAIMVAFRFSFAKSLTGLMGRE